MRQVLIQNPKTVIRHKDPTLHKIRGNTLVKLVGIQDETNQATSLLPLIKAKTPRRVVSCFTSRRIRNCCLQHLSIVFHRIVFWMAAGSSLTSCLAIMYILSRTTLRAGRSDDRRGYYYLIIILQGLSYTLFICFWSGWSHCTLHRNRDGFVLRFFIGADEEKTFAEGRHIWRHPIISYKHRKM